MTSLELAFDAAVWALTGALAVYLLSVAEPGKAWTVAVLTGLPLVAVHLMPVRRPVVVAIADVAWIVVAVAIVRKKRALGIGATVLCVVCTTGLRLEAKLNRFAPRAPTTCPVTGERRSARRYAASEPRDTRGTHHSPAS